MKLAFSGRAIKYAAGLMSSSRALWQIFKLDHPRVRPEFWTGGIGLEPRLLEEPLLRGCHQQVGWIDSGNHGNIRWYNAW